LRALDRYHQYHSALIFSLLRRASDYFLEATQAK
jgi:hypothetical protein